MKGGWGGTVEFTAHGTQLYVDKRMKGVGGIQSNSLHMAHNFTLTGDWRGGRNTVE